MCESESVKASPTIISSRPNIVPTIIQNAPTYFKVWKWRNEIESVKLNVWKWKCESQSHLHLISTETNAEMDQKIVVAEHCNVWNANFFAIINFWPDNKNAFW